jgi:hypothetical protein
VILLNLFQQRKTTLQSPWLTAQVCFHPLKAPSGSNVGKAIDNPNSVWPKYCPSLPAAYIFVVLFGIALVAHIVQAIIHRKPYSIVIIVSALMQTGSFVVRILSIGKVTDKTLYSDWFILLLVAPVWTNA